MSLPPLVDTYTVAIEGFSAFERTALASFFRLAAQRSPAYHQVEEAGLSDFLIADADHAGALEAVKRGQRGGDTVFIGSHAPPGAAAWLPRPIDPMHIVRELDTLVELRLALPEPPSGLLPLLPLHAPAGDPPLAGVDLLLERDSAPAAAAEPVPVPAPEPSGRGGAGRAVLVVEDSPVARQFLKSRLQRLQYRVELATSGEQALDMLAQRSYALVFLDIVLGPPGSVDGLRVCQAIKQGGVAARVIIVTGLDGASDRVRGSLAGADAYLVKPLMESDFLAALRTVDPAFEWADSATASGQSVAPAEVGNGPG
jgi:two-component system, cell cycle response regulator